VRQQGRRLPAVAAQARAHQILLLLLPACLRDVSDASPASGGWGPSAVSHSCVTSIVPHPCVPACLPSMSPMHLCLCLLLPARSDLEAAEALNGEASDVDWSALAIGGIGEACSCFCYLVAALLMLLDLLPWQSVAVRCATCYVALRTHNVLFRALPACSARRGACRQRVRPAVRPGSTCRRGGPGGPATGGLAVKPLGNECDVRI
jgi:hypothetical protein